MHPSWFDYRRWCKHPYINVFIKNVINGNLMEYLQLQDALNKQDDLYRVGRDYEIMLKVMTQLRDTADMKILA